MTDYAIKAVVVVSAAGIIWLAALGSAEIVTCMQCQNAGRTGGTVTAYFEQVCDIERITPRPETITLEEARRTK